MHYKKVYLRSNVVKEQTIPYDDCRFCLVTKLAVSTITSTLNDIVVKYYIALCFDYRNKYKILIVIEFQKIIFLKLK